MIVVFNTLTIYKGVEKEEYLDHFALARDEIGRYRRLRGRSLFVN